MTTLVCVCVHEEDAEMMSHKQAAVSYIRSRFKVLKKHFEMQMKLQVVIQHTSRLKNVSDIHTGNNRNDLCSRCLFRQIVTGVTLNS